MIFHWNPLVSRILTDLNIAAVRRALIRPPVSKFCSPISNPLGIIPERQEGIHFSFPSE